MSEDMVTRLAAMTPSQRNEHKKRVLKIYAQAEKMKPAELRAEIARQKEDDAAYAEHHARRENEAKPWEEDEEKSRISRNQLRQLVSSLRVELESYQRQMEAIPFDIPSDEIPYCLDWNKREYHVNLIEMLNPTLDSLFDMIDNYAKKHGCHEFLDFNSKLFQLKSEYAATGFRIGVLAGAIFAGCPNDLVNRFERGLEFACSTPGARMLKDNGL